LELAAQCFTVVVVVIATSPRIIKPAMEDNTCSKETGAEGESASAGSCDDQLQSPSISHDDHLQDLSTDPEITEKLGEYSGAGEVDGASVTGESLERAARDARGVGKAAEHTVMDWGEETSWGSSDEHVGKARGEEVMTETVQEKHGRDIKKRKKDKHESRKVIKKPKKKRAKKNIHETNI
jgi:hypothetical protein